MSEWIVSTKINGIRPDGENVIIEVMIGKPFKKDEEWWACPVSLAPLYARLASSVGSDALQSMCMAMALVIDLLEDFRQKGGRLLHEDGTNFALDAYAFGFALHKGSNAT